LSKNVNEFEQEKTVVWENEIESSSKDKLKEVLLGRDENVNLTLNFDPALTRLLKEVKYMKQMNIVIPESADVIYKKAETYRSQTTSLDMIIDM